MWGYSGRKGGLADERGARPERRRLWVGGSARCCRMHVPAFSAVTAAKKEGLNEQLSVLAAAAESHSE